jgi:ABC-type glycerol-3-phosphate transport system permease component
MTTILLAQITKRRRIVLKLGRQFDEALIHVLLLICSATMIFPLLWMVSTAFKLPGKQFLFPPQIIPNPLYGGNFVELFDIFPMWLYLFNSVKVSSLSVVGGVLSSSLAAFAFARLRFRGKNTLFVVLLATLMIPGQVTIIPTFVVIRALHLIDNHAALIIPSVFGGAFSVFVLRQFYLTIPQDLVDSAQIDGAGFFRIYWKVFIPLGMPALATVAVFNFLWSWNDLFGPLIFLNSDDNFTVTLALTLLRGRAGNAAGRWGVIMAGALLGVIPMLILYFIAQKYFVQGLARTGLKG